MLPFPFHLHDGEPVSDQIIRAAHRAFANGDLRPGDLFPSVRALAMDLKISPTTAHKVIGELKDLGFLISRPGIGMVIQAPALPPLETRLEMLTPSARKFLDDARSLHLSVEEITALLQHLQSPSE